MGTKRTRWAMGVVVLISLAAGGGSVAADEVTVRPLHGHELTEARSARDEADRLRHAYEAAHRPGPVPREGVEAFRGAEQAYEAVSAAWPHTELDAYCRMRLAGLYQYAYRWPAVVEQKREVMRLFRGTEHEQQAMFALGLFHLQGMHDPVAARAWLEQVQEPPAAEPDVRLDPHHEQRSLYRNAQIQMMKAEVQLGQLRAAADRRDRIAQRFPQAAEMVHRQFRQFVDEAEAQWADLPPEPPPIVEPAVPAAIRPLLDLLEQPWQEKVTREQIQQTVADLEGHHDAVVETVVRGFWDPPQDYAYRHRTVWVLEAVDNEAAREALLAMALREEDAFDVRPWRQSSARAFLATLEDPSEAAVLLESDDPRVLGVAVAGLRGQPLDDATFDRLLELIHRRDEAEAASTWHLRQNIAAAFAADPAPERAARKVGSIAEAIAAVADMPDGDQPGGIHGGPTTRAEDDYRAFIAALEQIAGADAPLAAAMEQADVGGPVWRSLVLARARRGQEAVRPQVQRIVQDPRAAMFRAWAAEALGRLGRPADLALLRRVAQNDPLQRPRGGHMGPMLDLPYFPVRDAADRAIEVIEASPPPDEPLSLIPHEGAHDVASASILATCYSRVSSYVWASPRCVRCMTYSPSTRVSTRKLNWGVLSASSRLEWSNSMSSCRM